MQRRSQRRKSHIEAMCVENYHQPRVMEAAGSDLTNKVRGSFIPQDVTTWVGVCNIAEQLAITRAKRIVPEAVLRPTCSRTLVHRPNSRCFLALLNRAIRYA